MVEFIIQIIIGVVIIIIGIFNMKGNISLLHSYTSSTNTSDIFCNDSSFVSSSSPVNIKVDPLGSIIVLSDLLTLQ